MEFNFDNDRPIYIQLVDNLKKYIISGKVLPGDKLPSVRDLALMIKVNPNTIQSALSELEEIGLIYTERTNGKYVTNNKSIIAKYKKDLIKKETSIYLSSMNELGLNKKEVIKYLKEED
mgnify:CR=1 FL=1